MERKPYSAGAVKFSFWFMEFRKTVQLLSEGKSFADIKKLNEETNIYGAPTKLRAQQIYSTVTARIKTLDESFYPIFLSSDLATQKLFVLTAALLHDTLFFDFVYEVVREKMILGSDELTDADIRIFVYFYHKLKCCGNQWNKKGAKIFFKIKRQKITFAVIASERIRRSSGRAAARYGLALSKKTAGLRAVRLADKPFYLGCSLPEHLFLSVWSIIFTYRIG